MEEYKMMSLDEFFNNISLSKRGTVVQCNPFGPERGIGDCEDCPLQHRKIPSDRDRKNKLSTCATAYTQIKKLYLKVKQWKQLND